MKEKIAHIKLKLKWIDNELNEEWVNPLRRSELIGQRDVYIDWLGWMNEKSEIVTDEQKERARRNGWEVLG